jgi:predicted phage terminase large subunit-like protein
MSDNPQILLDADQAAAELCKRHLSFFVKEFWPVVIAEELVWSDHMQVMCDEIQKVYEQAIARKPKLYDLIINIPPGTSKSTVCTIMAPAWAWAKDDSLRCITGSYSDALATEHSVKSRDIIESDLYHRYFPNVLIKYDKGRKTNYESTGLGQRYATSVGGTVTGIHAHVITIDDPLNPKQAASQTECNNANQWMDKTLSMRKVDKALTPTILVMQRLATNDCTGYLLAKQKGNVRHVCLPAEISERVSPPEYKSIYKDGLLDPARLSATVLKEARLDLGGDGYAGQMAQTPVQEGGLIWRKWFIEIDDAVFPDMKDATMIGSDWDLAYTDDDSNAASAYITAGKILNKAFIWDFDYAFLEFPELIKYMKQRRAPHYIEAKASGKSAKQALSRAGIPAIEIKLMGSKDKIARAKMATPPVEAGLVYIKKSLADRLYNDDRQGILNFPRGQHKDVADALAQAMQRLFGSGVSISRGGATAFDMVK